jgi:hypothetical protein
MALPVDCNEFHFRNNPVGGVRGRWRVQQLRSSRRYDLGPKLVASCCREFPVLNLGEGFVRQFSVLHPTHPSLGQPGAAAFRCGLRVGRRARLDFCSWRDRAGLARNLEAPGVTSAGFSRGSRRGTPAGAGTRALQVDTHDPMISMRTPD